jgi:phosphonate transport system permease protein
VARGAGGIGQTLYESVRSFMHAGTAAQVIIVVATVVFIDLLSARLRKALVLISPFCLSRT